jgi:hypothetical protein
MDRQNRLGLMRRARAQLICAIVFAVLALGALIFPVWIEELTGLSPDHRNGEFEVLVAVPFGLASCVLGFFAFRTRRALVAGNNSV